MFAGYVTEVVRTVELGDRDGKRGSGEISVVLARRGSRRASVDECAGQVDLGVRDVVV